MMGIRGSESTASRQPGVGESLKMAKVASGVGCESSHFNMGEDTG